MEKFQKLEREYEKEIMTCCTTHMPKYQASKITGNKRVQCNLNVEMIPIARSIIKKINTALDDAMKNGTRLDVKRISDRKKFVSGVLKGLVDDSKRCKAC